MKIKSLRFGNTLSVALLVLLLNALGTTKVFAVDFDFSAICSTGQTLYYKITDNTTHEVQLTYPKSYSYVVDWGSWGSFVVTDYWRDYSKPIGDICVPNQVMYNGIHYSVVSIRNNTFYECSSITSITIPLTVSSIGDYAMRSCSGLTSITSLVETPPALGINAFYEVDKSIPVYVPYGTIGAYQTVSGWNEFTNFIETSSQLEGVIDGLFSVSENTQVYFSQGNLQYQASTDTWQFAEHQWDFVGEDNMNASSTYDGWIDIFAWSTSGYDHGNGESCYEPWSSCGQYGHGAYGDNGLDLGDKTGQADWGYNAIANGGNQERLWRTCTTSEWQYLLYNRQTPSGIRFAKAVVNGINGLVILPDDWDAANYALNDVNEGYVSYVANIISLEDWTNSLEVFGAVFLPEAGKTTDVFESMFGSYYTASCSVPWLKERILFSENELNVGADYSHQRNSVRLVRSPQGATYSIEAVSNPADVGTVEGSGIYDYYASANLTAIPNEGYTFICWKENGRVVSTDNTYEVLALFNRNLEACFFENSTYPLTYSYNEEDHTATVTGLWEGVELTGELVIPETVMHNGETYTVTAIGDNAFHECSNMTSVVFPNTLVSIGNGAFSRCYGLTSVIIPSSVVSIGFINPFSYCSNLESIIVEEGNMVYDSRDNSNAIIETSTNILKSGSNSTVIPNTISELGMQALAGFSFTTLTLPASLQYLGTDVFMGTSMELLNILAPEPPGCRDWAFYGFSTSTPISVPCGSIEAYQNAEGWNEFTNIQEYIHDLTVVSSDESMGTVAILQEPGCETDAIVQATPIGDYVFFKWTENGEIVSTEATYTFPLEEDRTLTAHFGMLTNHWTPESYQNSMFMIGFVTIDGVEQASPTLELGAFCNGECRGTEISFEEDGRWLYFMAIGGNDGDEIMFRLYDHALQQELDLYCYNVLPFEGSAFIGLDDPYEVRFASSVTISAEVSPVDGGTVTGTGDYAPETSVTLVAAPNEGYAFNCWTLDGEVVSTEPSYTFTVTESMNFTAHFDVLQLRQLTAGWNWFSSYLEITKEDLQNALLAALPNPTGAIIKSQDGNSTYRGGRWRDQNFVWDVAKMYMINVPEDCVISLTGMPINPAEHPITIAPNTPTWFGFPFDESMTPAEAIPAGFAVNGDMIKGINGNIGYYGGRWRAQGMNILEPGQGYIYISKSAVSRTLIFPTNKK